ncbi:MAG TPA: hypothetical protein VGE24_05015, partial [Emticicia sp.]
IASYNINFLSVFNRTQTGNDDLRLQFSVFIFKYVLTLSTIDNLNSCQISSGKGNSYPNSMILSKIF